MRCRLKKAVFCFSTIAHLNKEFSVVGSSDEGVNITADEGRGNLQYVQYGSFEEDPGDLKGNIFLKVPLDTARAWQTNDVQEITRKLKELVTETFDFRWVDEDASTRVVLSDMPAPLVLFEGAHVCFSYVVAGTIGNFQLNRSAKTAHGVNADTWYDHDGLWGNSLNLPEYHYFFDDWPYDDVTNICYTYELWGFPSFAFFRQRPKIGIHAEKLGWDRSKGDWSEIDWPAMNKQGQDMVAAESQWRSYTAVDSQPGNVNCEIVWGYWMSGECRDKIEHAQDYFSDATYPLNGLPGFSHDLVLHYEIELESNMQGSQLQRELRGNQFKQDVLDATGLALHFFEVVPVTEKFGTSILPPKCTSADPGFCRGVDSEAVSLRTPSSLAVLVLVCLSMR